MRAEIQNPNPTPGMVGRFTLGQIAQRSTWNRLPDVGTNLSAMHVIRMRPANGSTVVQLNPTDPGTVDGGDGNDYTENGPGWLMRPGAYGPSGKHR